MSSVQEWRSGLCSFMEDTSGCCDWLFCYPCNMGRNCHAIDASERDTHDCMCCLAAMFTNPAYIIWACCLRKKMGEKYQMDLGLFDWCLISWICPACSNCQVSRELTLRNMWPGGACCNKSPYMK